jgi:hypothetical protein
MKWPFTSEAQSPANGVADFFSNLLFGNLVYCSDLLANQDDGAALWTSEEHKLPLPIATWASFIP